MDRERLAWLRLGAMAADAMVVAAMWVVAVQLRIHFHAWWPFDLVPGAEPVVGVLDPRHMSLVGLVTPVWVLALHSRGAYHYLRRKRPGTLLAELVIAGATALVGTVAVIFLLDADWVSRLVLVTHGVLAVPALFGARTAALGLLQRLRRGHFDVYRVVLLGPAGDAGPFREVLKRHPEWGIEVAGRVSTVEALAALLVEEAVDEVYVTRIEGEALGEAARLCDELGVRFSLDANFLGMRAARAELVDFEGWSLLSFSATPTDHALLAVKRALDVVGAGLGLLVLSPFLLGVALAVKLQDGGPVLFVQQRSGRFGRPFPMLKFRTMVVGAEQQRADLEALNEVDGPVFKLARDPRVTPVGRFLRRTSLDELPQLGNVLAGHMSLVGPRPPLPGEVAQYARWQLRRLSMRPGLTCIWQVSGRSDVDFDRWMELDLHYIDNWSLWLDLVLLVRTVPAVLRGTGAR